MCEKTAISRLGKKFGSSAGKQDWPGHQKQPVFLGGPY